MAKQKRVLITGITGQDGQHLTELLDDKGYEIFGLIRGQHNARRADFEAEFPDVTLLEGDLTDPTSLLESVKESQPDEIYNLGAISHVGYSFHNPQVTTDVNGKGVLNVLEAVRAAGMADDVRIYQASTSEMFGGQGYNRPPSGYHEESPVHPRSPYGVSKLYGHWIARNYRESYGMYVSSGIQFNHEGERRGHEFVTRKISDAVARIHLGLQQEVVLGDLWPQRDWGYAGDYVYGMWLTLQHDEPDDFVLATGEPHSVEEFVATAFRVVGIEDWRDHVRQDPKLLRPAEVDVAFGDASKAEQVLGWKRDVDFEGLVTRMVRHDLDLHARAPSL